MKFTLEGPFKDNMHSLMRKAGYYFQDKKDEDLVFTRPPRGYPRFHIYLKVDGSTRTSSEPQSNSSPQEINSLIFNLHLDQKKPIYKGTVAHSGEYKGKTVEGEAERIKQLLKL